MEAIFIEDVPSPMTEEKLNQRFENSFLTSIPIIEYAETPAETTIKTHDETPVETLAETGNKNQPA